MRRAVTCPKLPSRRQRRGANAALAKSYGGKVAYERARAEGKTDLNYHQWLQVRTEAFKAWFGDWEAGRAEDRMDAMQPVELKLNEALHSKSAEELRVEVTEHLKKLARGKKTAKHPDIGEVGFSTSKIGKVIHTSGAMRSCMLRLILFA